MKISYQWLCELTGLDWSPEEMGDRLTLSGTACEGIESMSQFMDRVIVAEVTELHPVEGADRIQRAVVNTGSETMDVICGAPNVAVGQRVPLATIGAKLANGLEIKETEIRGVSSAGMLCAPDELGISPDHSGIMVLSPDAKVGTPLVKALDFDDYVLDLELTPDRADSMSAVGVARDLAALAGGKLRKPEYSIRNSGEKAADYVSVRIDDPEGCPRYAARIIRNLKIGPSPWWLQRRLLAAGMRPISNIVDVTNYVMLETGNPLHAFDYELFGSKEVVVRRARDKEMFVTLDEEEHELTPTTVLITNGSEAVAAGGVMGGLKSGIKDTTTTVLLEAAYFDPGMVRRSRRELGLNTESSIRFEKGADPNNVPVAMDRAAYLFQELCGGEVAEGMVDCYPTKIKPRTTTYRPSRCKVVLGIEIPVERMKQIFTALEFEVKDGDPMEVTVPTFRHDIFGEIDLVEEIGRIVGYDEIPNAVGNIGPLYTPVHRRDTFADDLRRVMTAAGYDEINGHGLDSSKLAKLVGPDVPQLRCVNPISEDLDIVRNGLRTTALQAVSHNVAHRNLDLRLFEIGRAYFPPNKKGEWVEEDRLSIVVSGNTPSNWRDKARPHDFHDLAGALFRLAQHFRLPEIQYEATREAALVPGEAFAVQLGGKPIGTAGRLAPEIARAFDIKQDVFIAELALAPVMAAETEQAVFKSLPVYPAALRDIAMVIDESVRVGEVIATVRKVAGPLAESVELFDVYTGKQIAGGRKSVAIAISFRSEKGSLSNEEVDELQGNIVSSLKRDFNADIRDR